MAQHSWTQDSDLCSCGQDTIVCQWGDGHIICSTLTSWLPRLGNFCNDHLAEFKPKGQSTATVFESIGGWMIQSGGKEIPLYFDSEKDAIASAKILGYEVAA